MKLELQGSITLRSYIEERMKRGWCPFEVDIKLFLASFLFIVVSSFLIKKRVFLQLEIKNPFEFILIM